MSDAENDAKFRIFDPCEGCEHYISGGVGEICLPIVEALPTTGPPEYIRWPSTVRLLSAGD